MNKAKLLMLALLFVSACDASAQKEPNPDFKKVFESISAKNALSQSFRAHLKNMRPLCTERPASDPQFDRMGNVRCEKTSDVTTFNLVGSESPVVTMLDATVAGSDKCTYMRARLVQLYGKPAESTGACNGSWIVKRKGKPIVHIAIEEDKKENLVYFSHQEEQGP